ncbi:hypothetical protein TWF718_001158 [Orbilia javanica]|uniref:Nucleotidyltransferase family protein n=1 Tax=Orbilia javanica TaxID=47235 RepID=A0AAN8RMI1_9PEZI
MENQSTPEIDHGTDYLYRLAEILRKYNHPIVLVEVSALRYMGVRVSSSDIDLLIRDSQYDSIKADFEASKVFRRIAQNYGARLSDRYVEEFIPRFYSDSSHKWDTNAVNLWSESFYKLKIEDAELTQVEGITVLNPHVVDERFTRIIETEELSVEKLRSHGCFGVAKGAFRDAQFFLPSIPALCQALLRQEEHRCQIEDILESRPVYQLENLIRYLYLENPAHRDILLPLLGPHKHAMEELIRKYKRKPHTIIERGSNGEWTVSTKQYH